MTWNRLFILRLCLRMPSFLFQRQVPDLNLFYAHFNRTMTKKKTTTVRATSHRFFCYIMHSQVLRPLDRTVFPH